MSSPLPKVSASKYPGKAAPRGDAPPEAFPVRFKLKGRKDGPVYQGQKRIRECKNCP